MGYGSGKGLEALKTKQGGTSDKGKGMGQGGTKTLTKHI